MNVKKQEKEGTILWIGFLSFLRLSGEKKKKVIQKGVTSVLSVLLTFFSLPQSKIHLLSEYMCPIKKKVQAYLTVISTDLGSDVKYNLWPCSK